MPRPIDADWYVGSNGEVLASAVLEDPADHPGEAGHDEDVDRDRDERPSTAHPAAQLLDPDGGDARHRDPRQAGAGGGDVHAGTSCGRSVRPCPVTCRKSSSRSLAAREKLEMASPPATALREQPRASPASSPRKPSSSMPSGRIAAEATSGWPPNQARAASRPSPSARTLARRTEPTRRRCSISEILPDGQHLAVVEDRHRGAELLELGQDVAADQDRLAQRPQLPEELPQLDPGPRVEARRRLVQEQDLGIVDQRMGQAEALLHAPREPLDVGLALVGEVDQLQEIADDPLPGGGREAVAAGEEVEVLPDPHVVVDPERVRHEAEDATDLVGVPAHRPAGDLGLAGRRLEERGQDPEGRRLAGAVGPDQAEDLALLDVEVEAGDGERLVVALHEALGLDDRCHEITPLIETWNWKPTPWSAESLTNRKWTAPVDGSTNRAGSLRVYGPVLAEVRETDPGAGRDVEDVDLRDAVEARRDTAGRGRVGRVRAGDRCAWRGARARPLPALGTPSR